KATRSDLDYAYAEEIAAGTMRAADYSQVQQKILAKSNANLSQADQGLLLLALCGMGFFGNMAWGPFLAVPAEIFTPEVYGKAMGFVNGAGYTVAAFSAKIFAALVVVQQGHKVYTNGWYFIYACVVLGIVAACFIRTGRRAEPRAVRAADA